MRTQVSEMRSQEYLWLVSSDDYQFFDPGMVDWKHHRADELDEDDLADAFYGLLDDPELREVFRDLTVGDE